MSTPTETYNGWTNYETWIVNLWLTNDPYSYDKLQYIIGAFETVSQQAYELENCVSDDYERESSMWSDLIESAMQRVNWYEIVEANCA